MGALEKFFEEFGDIEISFQSKRNYTDPEKLKEYISDLEAAVEHYSQKTLDEAVKDRKAKMESDRASDYVLALEKAVREHSGETLDAGLGKYRIIASKND